MSENPQRNHKNNFVIGAFSHKRVIENLPHYIDPEIAALILWLHKYTGLHKYTVYLCLTLYAKIPISLSKHELLPSDPKPFPTPCP